MDALPCRVVLDEVKLLKGQVKRLFGHKGGTLVMWDDLGRAFSCNVEETDLAESPSYVLDGVLPADCYVRDAAFDLRFC